MINRHGTPRRPPRVAEAVPVQVYLSPMDRERLERLAEQLDSSRSEVLRQGLLALEKGMLDPAVHPALRIIGLAEASDSGPPDPAVHHDRVLADLNAGGLRPGGRRRRGAR